MFKNLNPTDVTCVIAYDNDDLIPSCGGDLKLLHVAFKPIDYIPLFSKNIKVFHKS